MRAFFLLSCLALGWAGCGPEAKVSGPQALAIDSSLVDLLIDLHLADARSEADSLDESASDSTRASVLRHHGETADGLNIRLEDLASEPEEASATYLAIETRLQMERQGATP